MKKIIIAIFTMLLITIAFSSATFAWISLPKTGLIDDIYLTAILGDQLEISIDGVNYYKELPKEELEKHLKTLNLTSVTTTDAERFSFLESQGVRKLLENRDYLSLDFYFRTLSNYERDVYLANNISNIVDYNSNEEEGTYIISKGVEFRSPIEYLYDIDEYVKKGQVKTYYAKDSIRVSTTFKNKTKIFDLSENEHRGFGKQYGAVDYFEKYTRTKLNIPKLIPTTIYKLSEFSPNSPFSYDEVSKIMELNDVEIIKGVEYYTGKVTIKVWLEGWDADMFDPILTDRIKIKLQFKSVRGKISN